MKTKINPLDVLKPEGKARLHTAGPWRVAEHNGVRSIEAPCDHPACKYDHKSLKPHFVYEICKMSFVNDEENAEFICRAVNCHEELLEALRQILEFNAQQHTTSKTIDIIARAAIAKAQGGAQ